MRAAISEAIAEQVTGTESKGSKLVDRISTEQRAALESKFNVLALEIRSAIASKYPGLSTVEMYMLRQMVKEANGKLASNRRPVWYNILTLNAASLKSGEESIRKYQSRSIETAQIIQELIDLAKDMREANKRGEELGFSDEELAFYDALEVNDSAVKVLGDETLKTIARELVNTVRKNTTIDWTVKESVRAKLRTMVKRILRKYGYPPDKQEKATQTVLEQAELLCRDWAS